jgi:hypothetical protein
MTKKTVGARWHSKMLVIRVTFISPQARHNKTLKVTFSLPHAAGSPLLCVIASTHMSRWSKELDDKLRELFREGLADPRKQDSKYIKEVFEKTDWLKNSYKLKNFYPLYRRKADEWTIEQSKSGARRKSCSSCPFREGFDFEEPTLSFKIKLPFKVDNAFFKEVVWYRHDDEELRADAQFYYMMHVELLSATKPRVLRTQIGRRVVDTPPRQQQQPEPEPDEHHSMDDIVSVGGQFVPIYMRNNRNQIF